MPQAASARLKSGLGQATSPAFPTSTRSSPKSSPRILALQKEATLSERKQNFAKSTLRRKVGNRTFPTGYEAGADLAGHLSERRAFRVSFVRAAYGATGVKQESWRVPEIAHLILLTQTIPPRISAKLIHVPNRTNFRHRSISRQVSSWRGSPISAR
ncbi:Hypothetical protein DPCES_4394 [Desulfitobacterium hafniense]|uniref:Uncharacterized protein n=1 Tax=Desulfitobacterium hafniense TaxID=49338 RepID=A0A098B7B0_DESHA|nr:Hypothetical protein DPCES_4394 [Desulfitobacterium hafniense]